jgi:biotin carboxyl carrier protein
MRVKKKKQKATYAIVEVSTASNKEVGHYYLGKKSFKELQKSARKTLAMGIALVILSVGLILFAGYYMLDLLQDKEKEIENLTAQIEAINSEKDEIQGSLDEKIMAEQEKEANDALMYVPTNYPVTGASTVTETDEVVALDATSTSVRPVANFVGSEGAKVVAAGSGTVLAVEEDANYGFKMTIDHGNGYITLYYNGGNPLVKKGDKVTKDTVLFEIGSFNTNVAFQIIENGTYISPMSFVDIQG